MSFEEKGTWLYAVIAVALPVTYLATILGQLPNTAVTEIDYQGLLLAAVGATIGLAIVGMIVIGIASPRDAGKADQRDKEINRLGEYVGGTALGIGMVVPFGLAMVEVPHFLIANAMYLTFSLAALVGAAVKLVLYRRGI